MMMFETSKHVPKTEKRCCVFENNIFLCFKLSMASGVLHQSYDAASRCAFTLYLLNLVGVAVQIKNRKTDLSNGYYR